MNNIRYCLPILSETIAKVEKTVESNFKNYDFLEIWLSLINNLDVSFLKKLTEKYPGKLIFIMRHPPLSESRLSSSLREQIIKHVPKGNAFFDFDIKLQLKDLEKFYQDVSLITSYHNFEETPSNSELETHLKSMSAFKPTIYKIATYCNTASDALRLLQLGIDCKEKGMRVIILGMGKYGAITRVFGTLWSNEFVYAPLDITEASAPDQLTRQQLEKIFEVLNAG